jgi:hypothetical protein
MTDESNITYESPAEESVSVSDRVEELKWELIAAQNMPMALVYGGLAMVISALVWAAITYLISMEIGWIAIGAGWLVGTAVKKGGNGVNLKFGILGGVLAFLAVFMGKYFAIIAIVSKEYAIPLMDVLTEATFGEVMEVLKDTFSPYDLLFYGFAIYEGFRFAFSPLEDLLVQARLALRTKTD